MRAEENPGRHFHGGFLRSCIWFALSIAALAGCSDDSKDLSITIAGSPAPDPAIARDAQVASIYGRVGSRDIAGLLALQNGTYTPPPTASPTPSGSPPPASVSQPSQSPMPMTPTGVGPSPTPDPAIALALFVIDRTRFRDEFVAAYPHDEQGVSVDYGSRLVNAHIVPKGALFPIEALSGLAIGGDDDARQHLIAALPYATGGIGDAYAREAARVLTAAPPQVALADLAALPSHLRIAVTSEVGWCARRPDALLAASPQPLPTATPIPTPVPTGSAASGSPSAPQLVFATPYPTLAPGASPSPSPTPLLEALVQQQIRQTLGTCDYLAAQSRAEDRARHRKAHKHRAAPKKQTKA